jgi:paraquat-inducible protein A
MTVSSVGAHRVGWMMSGVSTLWSEGFPSLATLTALFSIALPFVYLSLLIGVLASLHFGWQDRTPWVGKAFRWAKYLRPWMMLEVFLIGGFVAYSRIEALATVQVGIGGWSLIAATLMLLLALTQLDERTVWEALPGRTPESRGPHEAGAVAHSIACTDCDLIVPQTLQNKPCPRCGAMIHRRKPMSVQRTAALLIAGYLLYIPANLLPVLVIVRFGHEEHNTIMSGVFELLDADLWPLAVIVFVASIVLPLLKLGGLTWMLIAIRLGSGRMLNARTRFYRVIDVVGRWSNIDVFMASVLVAILQFGVLTSVFVDNGLVAFAAVVAVTMIATITFDTRIMWDVAGRNRGRTTC